MLNLDDLNEVALAILYVVDYDIWKEVKAEPFEDDTLESIKDILYDFKAHHEEAAVKEHSSC
jgi:hypothetical protein